MNSPEHPNISLTRRACLVWVGSALTACGGGGGGLASLVPGTGGTGSPIYSQGSISGFGSVIVNGIKFDDTQATILADGVAAQATDLRLGMVAGVQGQRSAADVTLGTAETVEVWSIALGPVESVGSASFVVAGMFIDTDSNTVLEGIRAGLPLVAGTTVVVWGLQMDTQGTRWKATRVEVVTPSNNRVVTGLVTRSNDQFMLGRWTLAGATGLPTGAMARVQGTTADNTRLNVSGTRLLNVGFESHGDGVLEIEGFVTSALVNNTFRLGNITVDVSAPALSALRSQLTVGQEIEVDGRWVSGVLLASQLSLEGEQSQSIEIEATIDQFTSVANFVLRGQRCDASAAVFEGGQASDLAKGVKIKVTGTIAGDVLRVTKLEFED